MGWVKRDNKKQVDTFQARNLHDLREKTDIGSFVEYRAMTEYSLGITKGRRVSI